MKRVKCDFCNVVLPQVIVEAEEGYCPECGEDLRDLINYKEKLDFQDYEDEEDDEDWDY